MLKFVMKNTSTDDHVSCQQQMFYKFYFFCLFCLLTAYVLSYVQSFVSCTHETKSRSLNHWNLCPFFSNLLWITVQIWVSAVHNFPELLMSYTVCVCAVCSWSEFYRTKTPPSFSFVCANSVTVQPPLTTRDNSE